MVLVEDIKQPSAFWITRWYRHTLLLFSSLAELFSTKWHTTNSTCVSFQSPRRFKVVVEKGNMFPVKPLWSWRIGRERTSKGMTLPIIERVDLLVTNSYGCAHTDSSRRLLEDNPEKAGIMLHYKQASSGQPRMVFSFGFVTDGEMESEDEGCVSFTVSCVLRWCSFI